MDLLRFLKENKETRKVFGNKELKIIEKQLFGAALTQSEKNRLSRDIRKKFEFIKAAANFSQEFNLKKGAEIKKMIEETKKDILSDILFKSINNIILYGSAAENKLTLRSDVDIAVEFSNINLTDATLFRRRILGKANPKIDLQVYNHLPTKIKKEIKSKGKILYAKENKR